MPFTAKYHGRCGFCDEDMKDDEVDYTEDETLVHTSCLPAYEGGHNPIAKPSPNEKMCSDCFTIHAGECV